MADRGRLGRIGQDLAATLRGSAGGLRETRDERETGREAAPGSLASVGSSALKGAGNQRITVYEDVVEVRTLNVLSEDVQRLRYRQIAGVSRRAGIFFSTVVVETNGGARFAAKGLPNADAALAVGLIEERLT